MKLHVDVPDEWAELWDRFDQHLEHLARSTRGVSCQDVSMIMRMTLDRPCTRHPAWRAWAAVRLGAATLGHVRDAAIFIGIHMGEGNTFLDGLALGDAWTRELEPDEIEGGPDQQRTTRVT